MTTTVLCNCKIPLAMSSAPGYCGYCAGRLPSATGPGPVENTPRIHTAAPPPVPGDTRMPDPNPDIYDPTAPPPGVTALPSVVTSMTPDTFKEWLAADGDLFVVYLPDRRSFIIKVPELHHAFFVSIMQQIKFVLGPEVQAIRMTVVSGPPPDFDERGDPIPPADGKADRAPNWAQPDHPPRPTVDHEPPAEHVYHQPGMEPATGPTLRPRCAGSQQPGINVNHADRSCWRGDCPVCGTNRKLTWAGNLPGHHHTATP